MPAAAAQEGPTTPETIRLKAFLRHPDPKRMERMTASAERMKGDERTREECRSLLRGAFEKTWIDGAAKGSKLTLDQFDAITRASGSEPLGKDRIDLVDILRQKQPAAWERPEFLGWLRRELPAQSSGRLLEGVPSDPVPALDRLAMIMEIVPETEVTKVQETLGQRIGAAGPGDVVNLHGALARLGGSAGLERWQRSGADVWSRRALGDRFFQIPPSGWPSAGDALESLVRGSSHAPIEFFEKAAGNARTTAPGRAPPAVGVLSRLSALSDPARAYAALSPASNADWLAWLHETEVLPDLHGRDTRLVETSYSSLKGLSGSGDPGRLLEILLAEYYTRPAYVDRVFADMIRPWASSRAPREVLAAALKGRLSAGHRDTLGRDLIAGRAGKELLGSPWTGGPSRIRLAMDLYLGLVPQPAYRAALQAYLASPLLEDIVTGIVQLYRMGESTTETVAGLMEVLAARMVELREKGADTAHSKALRRLEEEILRDLRQAMAELPRQPPPAQGDLAAWEEPIRRFVRTLALALRLDQALENALGGRTTWFDQAVAELRTSVFGLGAVLDDRKVIYWSEAMTRFRARLLVQLDGPLGDCLRAGGHTRQQDAVWRDLYLPLVRVHGLVRITRELAGAGRWPHRLWVKTGALERGNRSIARLFEALDTDRWLDADDAVLELATVHLETLGVESAWATHPGRIFAGRWGENASLRVYRRLLAADPAAEPVWKLDEIAAWVLEHLEKSSPPSGPTFPIAGALPTVDAREPLWNHARWILNLITAAEWKSYAFLTREGAAIDWRELVKRTGPEDEPFRCRIERPASSRRVDGRMRAHYLQVFQSGPGSSRDPERLLLLSRAAMFLPNAADNLVGDAGQLDGFRAQRQSVYVELAGLLGPGSTVPEASREAVLRATMHLDASTREAGRLLPSFDPLVGSRFVEGSRDRDHAALILENVRAARAELMRIAAAGKGGSLQDLRAAIDALLDGFGGGAPCDQDGDLRHRNWKKRLEALDEDRVLLTLQLRAHLKALLHRVKPGPEAAPDLTRIARLLDLIDDTVFFSRADFDQDQVTRYVRALPRGSEPGTWRPALTVLAWCDSGLQKKVLDVLSASRPPGERGRDIESCLRRHLVRLNDASFRTMRAIALREVGDPRAIFQDMRPHRIRRQILDFRLLCEAIVEEEASAETLSRDCFEGVLTNVRLRLYGQEPSDEGLMVRLFGGSDAGGREAPAVGLDEVVSFADSCAGAEGLPGELRAGASTFLETGNENLLDNAATVKGVLSVTSRILETVRAPATTPRHRGFYERSLALVEESGPVLSPGMRRAVAAPFFRGSLADQKQGTVEVLDFWRDHMLPWEGTPTVLDSAVRSGTGTLVEELVRGEGRPEKAPYLWAPAHALEKESGVRRQSPVEFFALVDWWLSLEKDTDPATIREMFRLPPAETGNGGAP